MSHFVVLVIGDNVEELMAPYHEFECTGTDDQYVQNIDVLAKYREEYENCTYRGYKKPNGEIVSAYTSDFYRKPTEKEYEQIKAGTYTAKPFAKIVPYKDRHLPESRESYRITDVPKGYVLGDYPARDRQTFASWLAEEYGYERLLSENEEPDMQNEDMYGWARADASGEIIEVVRRTNPNKKWDWWVVGGRWSGFLRMKATPEPFRPILTGLTNHESMHESDEDVNSMPKKLVDFDGMEREASDRAAKEYDWYLEARKGAGLLPDYTWKSWKVLSEERRASGETDYNVIREAYFGQPVLAKLRAWALDRRDAATDKEVAAKYDFVFNMDSMLVSRGEYIEKARKDSYSPYAVVKDGKWYAHGEMGWFGVSDEQVGVEDWHEQVKRLLDETDDDTLITVVDCHI